MIPILFPEEVSRADDAVVERTGIPDLILMENAAVSLCDAIIAEWDYRYEAPPTTAVIICGPGNNGADGMALGRHLAGNEVRVRLLLCAPEEKINDLARKQLSICRAIPGIEIETVDMGSMPLDVREEIVVDAMLGTGATGPLRPPYDHLVDVGSFSGFLRVAVDIPTGIDGRYGTADGPYFKADLTVTMGAVKPGLLFNEGAGASGEVLLANLSLPVSFYSTNRSVLDRDVASYGLKDLRRGDHKYDRGNLLIVAGSRRMTGAAALAASGALYAGAGLVTVAVPEEVFEGARSILPPEVMLIPLPSRDGRFAEAGLDIIREEIDSFDVLVAGPGIGRSEGTARFLEGLVTLSDVPLVLDADGLQTSVIQAAVERRNGANPVVITPHHGEMARLLERSSDEIGREPMGVASETVESLGVEVVLKGAPTVVASRDWVLVNSVGNRGMASGGTGDVLTGVLGGMLTGRSEATWSERIAAAVWCHSRGADIALEEGESVDGLTASMIARYVALAIGELREEHGEENS